MEPNQDDPYASDMNDSFDDIVDISERNSEDIVESFPQQMLLWTTQGLPPLKPPPGEKTGTKKKSKKKSSKKKKDSKQDGDEALENEGQQGTATTTAKTAVEPNLATALEKSSPPNRPTDDVDVETVFPVKEICVCADDNPDSPIGVRTSLNPRSLKERRKRQTKQEEKPEIPMPPLAGKVEAPVSPTKSKKSKGSDKSKDRQRSKSKERQRSKSKDVIIPKSKEARAKSRERQQRFERPESWRYSRYFNSVLEQMQQEAETPEPEKKSKKRHSTKRTKGEGEATQDRDVLLVSCVTETSGTTAESSTPSNEDVVVTVLPETEKKKGKSKRRKSRARSRDRMDLRERLELEAPPNLIFDLRGNSAEASLTTTGRSENTPTTAASPGTEGDVEVTLLDDGAETESEKKKRAEKGRKSKQKKAEKIEVRTAEEVVEELEPETFKRETSKTIPDPESYVADYSYEEDTLDRTRRPDRPVVRVKSLAAIPGVGMQSKPLNRRMSLSSYLEDQRNS